MKLSIIIVNYNVKYFLYQCLKSIRASQCSFDYEVIVVDNHSRDHSHEFIPQQFPSVKYLYLPENLGFSKANNVGLKEAQGEYILFLNPDTLIAEDTLAICVDFMDQHPEAGALGVKMIDASGQYLPESKRGLPTPETAFYKVTGLSSLFPGSKKINRYHLGYLDKNELNEVEILSGAFMMVRKNILNQTGGFDENYFMYGEDIDLSYRIRLLGYKNYYLPYTTILHYKGESTKKDTLKYVLTFYQAMAIFARTHFFKKKSWQNFLLYAAIIFRGTLSGIKRIIQHMFFPVIENGTFFFIILIFSRLFEQYIKIPAGEKFPEDFYSYAPVLLTFLHALLHFVTGSYDKPYNYRKMFNGALLFSLTSLLIYSLLPEEHRYSRLLLVILILSSLLNNLFIRFLLHSTGLIKMQTHILSCSIILASQESSQKIKWLMDKFRFDFKITFYLQPPQSPHHPLYYAKYYHLSDMLFCFPVHSVFVNMQEISYKQLINQMESLSPTDSIIRLYHPEIETFISSKEILNQQEFFIHDDFAITHITQRRIKRITDIFLSLLILLLFPFLLFLLHKPMQAFKNLLQVLAGKKTWVGIKNKKIEHLRKGVLSVEEIYLFEEKFYQETTQVNDYLKNYRPILDIKFIFANLKKIDT